MRCLNDRFCKNQIRNNNLQLILLKWVLRFLWSTARLIWTHKAPEPLFLLNELRTLFSLFSYSWCFIEGFIIWVFVFICSYGSHARAPPHTHMQAGDHVCQISPFDVAPPGAVHFVLWVSISHWAQRWSWASWPAHPRALQFLSKAPASHPVFILSSFVLFVGSGDGFQILMLVQQALYQPSCFPSSQWPVFQLYYLAWLWWIRIFICLSPSHFA